MQEWHTLLKSCLVASIAVLGTSLRPCFAQVDPVDLSFIIAPGGASDPNCFTIDETVTVTVQMGPAQRVINGGQFIVDYDPDCVTLTSVFPAGLLIPGNPYVLEVAETVDPVAGTVFYSVITQLGGVGVPGDAALAVLSFVKQADCEACLSCIDVENSVLVDDMGGPVLVNPSCSTTLRTRGELMLSVPESVVENIVCASQATVTWNAPLAAASCGSAPMVCYGGHLEMGTLWDQEVVMGGGSFPFGTSSFCCTASSDCGDTRDACWSVIVQDIPCTDGVGCTVDTCLAGACVSIPLDANCDDASFCNGVEWCDPALGCQTIGVPNCDDGIACTIDTCDEVDDTCANVRDDALCDNGNFCDGTEFCDPGLGCQTIGVPDCNDGIACTIDSCDEVDGTCVNVPDDALCDNGDFCDGTEICDPGLGCQTIDVPNCDDGIACTIDTCDELDDICVDVPDDTLCDNGDFCDGMETCDLVNGCQTGSPPNCDDNVGCTQDVCDSIDGCQNIPRNLRCLNSFFCDGAEFCDPLDDCQPGTPPDCDDGIPCTTDFCHLIDDACAHLPDSTLCDNADFCDGSELCAPQIGCQSGVPRSCDPPGLGDDVCSGGSNEGEACSIDADCPDGACGNKSRYVSIGPPAARTSGSDPLSIRVTIADIDDALGFDDREGEVWWAGPSRTIPNDPHPALLGAQLVCESSPSNAEDWPFSYIHLFGAPLVPNSLYEVRMCDAAGSSCADPLYVSTGKWGDVVPPFGGGAQPGFGDISQVVAKFRGEGTAPDMTRTDLVGIGSAGDPNVPDQKVTFADITAAVNGFGLFAYPFAIPTCHP